MVEQDDWLKPLTDEERNFRLEGDTENERNWNKHYDIAIAEYDSAIYEEDMGLATSVLADIRKRYNGMQRVLPKITRFKLFRQEGIGL